MVRSQPLDDGPGRGASALVLAGQERYAERRALAELAGVSPLHANVLAVTYGRDADDWLTDWREGVGGRAASTAVLSPGEFARSAAAGAASTHELPGRTTVEAIDDPADLAALGDGVRSHLSRWADERRRCVLLFESVTGLLAHVPPREAFGFLHLLARETNRTGALGWFYADPAAHPATTVGTVADLFDAVVRPHGDDWRWTREYHPRDDGATDETPTDETPADETPDDETRPQNRFDDEN